MLRNLLAFSFAMLTTCCSSTATPPAQVPAGGEGVTEKCAAATAGLPEGCREGLAVGCSNVERSVWLEPDYGCLRAAESCEQAAECGKRDTR